PRPSEEQLRDHLLDEALKEQIHVDQEREGPEGTPRKHVVHPQPVQDHLGKFVSWAVMLIQSVVNDRTSPLQIQTVRIANLAEERVKDPYPSSRRGIGYTPCALAQRKRHELVLRDVLLMLVESAYEAIRHPEAFANLTI